jgi:hypothetical protein
MNLNAIRFVRVVGALALFVLTTELCRADLFAVMTSGSELLRLDSASGAVIDTYPYDPLMFPPMSINSGLAFDGRRVYMNRRRAPDREEVWALELASRTWYPLGYLDTLLVDPTGVARFSGLAYVPDSFGQEGLAAVSVRSFDIPSHLAIYPAFPIFSPFEPIFPSLAAPLPPDFDADGLDYDPTMNELWIAGEHVEGMTRTPMLLQTDLAGSAIQTLSPFLGDATIPRGLAFDDGRMFVAARHLPTMTNEVHEIDRANGAVLNSFVIPGDGMIAALTGGTVIPEPTAVTLFAVLLVFTAARRRVLQ